MGLKELWTLKTTVPRVTKKILPRRDIAKIINNTPLDEMIYLFAPHGSGKTMAVISWMQEHKKEVAWVSLNKGDSSPDTFWALLTYSLLRYAGEQEKADNLQQDENFIKNPRAFLSETIIHVARTKNDKVLIIDNCRFIQDIELLEELKSLVENMLCCWRLILIGRFELPSIFNDFALKKRLRLVTVDELSFSLEEMYEYFLMNGYDVDTKDLIRIQDETDGWPAALNAILTAPQNGTVRYGFAARAFIVGYFDKEIWNNLDETTKNFLIKTSVLDKLTPSICHSITGITETYLVLSKLYMKGFFMSKLEEYGSFCYHRVFKDFLLFKLSASDIDVNALYSTVGWWLYERNESAYALLCFYKANNICGINQAFKQVFPAKMGMDKYVEVASCLISLDINELKEYPEIAARIALLHFIMGNFEEMQRIYRIVIDWHKPGALSISAESYADFTWEVGWVRYVNPDEDILFNKDFEYWVDVNNYAPHLKKNDRSRSSALRLPSAMRSIRDYSIDIVRIIEYYETSIKIENGFIKDKADLFLTDLIIAEIAYEQEDFDKAKQIIKEVMPEIEREKFTELYFICTVLLVKMLRVLHDSREINALTDRLGAQIENNGHLYLMPNFHAFELRNLLENGKQGTTEIFEKENKPYADKPYYYLIYRHITLVRSLLSEDKYNEAGLLLGNLELLCRRNKRNMDLIEINILRAITEYGLEHKENAYKHIITALDAGRKSGFIRIFSDDAVNLLPILNIIRKSDIDDYIENVIISCKKSISGKEAVLKKRKLLTKAEIEVLKLLKSDLTYNQIAKNRKVGIHTIKSQISAIYSKLGVSSKVSAVMEAEKLGLFGKK